MSAGSQYPIRCFDCHAYLFTEASVQRHNSVCPGASCLSAAHTVSTTPAADVFRSTLPAMAYCPPQYAPTRPPLRPLPPNQPSPGISAAIVISKPSKSDKTARYWSLQLQKEFGFVKPQLGSYEQLANIRDEVFYNNDCPVPVCFFLCAAHKQTETKLTDDQKLQRDMDHARRILAYSIAPMEKRADDNFVFRLVDRTTSLRKTIIAELTSTCAQKFSSMLSQGTIVHPHEGRLFQSASDVRKFLVHASDKPFLQSVHNMLKHDIIPRHKPIREEIKFDLMAKYGFCDHPTDIAANKKDTHSFHTVQNDALTNYRCGFNRAFLKGRNRIRAEEAEAARLLAAQMLAGDAQGGADPAQGPHASLGGVVGASTNHSPFPGERFNASSTNRSDSLAPIRTFGTFDAGSSSDDESTGRIQDSRRKEVLYQNVFEQPAQDPTVELAPAGTVPTVANPNPVPGVMTNLQSLLIANRIGITADQVKLLGATFDDLTAMLDNPTRLGTTYEGVIAVFREQISSNVSIVSSKVVSKVHSQGRSTTDVRTVTSPASRKIRLTDSVEESDDDDDANDFEGNLDFASDSDDGGGGKPPARGGRNEKQGSRHPEVAAVDSSSSDESDDGGGGKPPAIGDKNGQHVARHPKVAFVESPSSDDSEVRDVGGVAASSNPCPPNEQVGDANKNAAGRNGDVAVTATTDSSSTDESDVRDVRGVAASSNSGPTNEKGGDANQKSGVNNGDLEVNPTAAAIPTDTSKVSLSVPIHGGGIAQFISQSGSSLSDIAGKSLQGASKRKAPALPLQRPEKLKKRKKKGTATSSVLTRSSPTKQTTSSSTGSVPRNTTATRTSPRKDSQSPTRKKKGTATSSVMTRSSPTKQTTSSSTGSVPRNTTATRTSPRKDSQSPTPGSSPRTASAAPSKPVKKSSSKKRREVPDSKNTTKKTKKNVSASKNNNPTKNQTVCPTALQLFASVASEAEKVKGTLLPAGSNKDSTDDDTVSIRRVSVIQKTGISLTLDQKKKMVYVNGIAPGTPSARSHLQVGMVVKAINGTDVKTLNEAAVVMKEHANLELTVTSTDLCAIRKRQPEPLLEQPFYHCPIHGTVMENDWEVGAKTHLNHYCAPGKFLERASCIGTPRLQREDSCGVAYAAPFLDANGTRVDNMPIRISCSRASRGENGFVATVNGHDDTCFRFCRKCHTDYESVPEENRHRVSVICNRCYLDFNDDLGGKTSRRGTGRRGR